MSHVSPGSTSGSVSEGGSAGEELTSSLESISTVASTSISMAMGRAVAEVAALPEFSGVSSRDLAAALLQGAHNALDHLAEGAVVAFVQDHRGEPRTSDTVGKLPGPGLLS